MGGFTPPPLSADEGPSKGFTPPPLSAHEGPADEPGLLSRFGSGLYSTTIGPIAQFAQHPIDTVVNTFKHVSGFDDINRALTTNDPKEKAQAIISYLKGPQNKLAEGIVRPIVDSLEQGDYAGAAGKTLGNALMLGGGKALQAAPLADIGESVAAAAPDVATGLAKSAVGATGAVLPFGPLRWFAAYPFVRSGLRQMKSGIAKGREAFQNAHDATGENMPMAGETSPAPEAAAAPTEDMQLLDDIAQGQAGKKFASLDAQGQAAVRALAAKIGGQQAAPDAAPGPYVPRPPSYYGVEPTPPAAATPPQAAPTSAPTSAPMVPQPGAAVGRPSTVRPIPETQAPALTISEPPGNVLPAPGKPAGPVRPPIAGQPQPEATAPAGGVPPTEIEASDLEGLLKQSLENASAKKRTLAQTEAAMVQKQPGEPPATPRPYIEEHAGPKMTGRGFDMENINRAAKVQRFADKLGEIGVGPDDIGKIPQGWMSDTQIRAGAIPGWGNIADYLGEGVPSELSIADIKNVLKKAK
jgi:hypothetical protein